MHRGIIFSAMPHYTTGRKPHIANPIPSVEVYVRPMGGMQFMCPLCFNMRVIKRVDWRRGVTYCTRCLKRFRVGVLVQDQRTRVGYGFYPTERFNGYTSNRLIAHTGWEVTPGRLTGSIDWICPQCATVQRMTRINRNKEDAISCAGCNKTFYIRLLMWQAAFKFKVRCPLDWMILDAKNIQPVAPAEAGAGAGTTSLCL